MTDPFADAFNELTSGFDAAKESEEIDDRPVGVEIRLKLEITEPHEGKPSRYGQLFVLPSGWPERFAHPTEMTQLTAAQIAATAFTTLMRHFIPDWTPEGEGEVPRA